ncbi:MAG: phosphatidate cytidylyltransferase [Treponema sp.]|jgi:phosphatidate cytidylyltransferase|nr:phosphatidate cytidylyltransferase [Treponema sp.]
MKKLMQRLLMFIIGLPLILFFVAFLTPKHHLALNIIVVIFSALGAAEFADMLRKKNITIAPPEAGILGSLGPIAMTLMVSFDISTQIVPMALTVGSAWLLVSGIFSRKHTLQDAISYMAGGLSVLLYPGMFIAWIIRMSLLPQANMVILMFLLMVFANDSAAWAVGMLFGGGNRGIVAASPNKSAAGFLGGCIASVLVGIGAALYIPSAFISSLLPPVAAGAILGFLSGIAAILGDLGESAMKRSANIKDSGSLIPGRGGVLDTIDSIALAAPVFYGLYWILFS